MPLSETDRQTRKGRVTASQLAAIAGLHPYETPLTAYLRATEPDQYKPSAAMLVGTYGEEGVAQAYAQECSASLEPCHTMVHPDHDWLAATPDRIASGGGLDERWVVEIKLPQTGASLRRWGPSGSQILPTETVCQVHGQMAVTGLRYAEVAAVIWGELRVYPIAWDPVFWEQLFSAALDCYHHHILPRIPPPMDGSPGAKKHLQQRYPRGGEGGLNSTPELDALASELHAAKVATKAAQEHQTKLENQLKALLGDHDFVASDWGQITWRATKPRVVTNWEAIAKSFNPSAELLEEHTTIKPGSRRFVPRFIED